MCLENRLKRRVKQVTRQPSNLSKALTQRLLLSFGKYLDENIAGMAAGSRNLNFDLNV